MDKPASQFTWKDGYWIGMHVTTCVYGYFQQICRGLVTVPVKKWTVMWRRRRRSLPQLTIQFTLTVLTSLAVVVSASMSAVWCRFLADQLVLLMHLPPAWERLTTTLSLEVDYRLGCICAVIDGISKWCSSVVECRSLTGELSLARTCPQLIGNHLYG